MTDLERLWLGAFEEVISRAAHEVKDALNGVSLNLEVIRSRAQRPDAPSASFSTFAAAAADQLELLSERTESMLFLARPHQAAAGQPDVAATLKHLATLLVPATKADGGSLEVDGYQRPAPTAASAPAVRLALAAGLLAFTKGGGSSRCRLELGSETVVRFSHESAGTRSLDPAVAKTLGEHHIRVERSDPDLRIVFPGF